nr:hypothetical protein [Tanacetum cinerariifolium]
MKEREVQEIKEIEKRLKERETQQQECLSIVGTTLDVGLVTEGAALEPSLVTEDIALNDNLVAKESTYDSVTSSEQLDESSSSGNDADAEKILVDTVASENEYADIGPSYDSDTVTKIESMKKQTFDSGISSDFLQKSLYDSDDSNVQSESREKKILFGNETSSFETKIKELELSLAQQTKDFEDAKDEFSMKTDMFETYFEKLKNTRVVLERQLDHKIQDSKAKKDQFLKQIAS